VAAQFTAMKTHFNVNFLEDSTETLRAIAHPIRIAIIDLLYNNGQMTVTDIYQQLHIEQAIASHHLRILKSKDVVAAERDGKNSLYSLTRPEFYEIIKTLKKVI
jgi:ArsR family transcriptional regulator